MMAALPSTWPRTAVVDVAAMASAQAVAEAFKQQFYGLFNTARGDVAAFYVRFGGAPRKRRACAATSLRMHRGRTAKAPCERTSCEGTPTSSDLGSRERTAQKTRDATWAST